MCDWLLVFKFCHGPYGCLNDKDKIKEITEANE